MKEQDYLRTWRIHAEEMASTKRLKLRRQMAAAAGKNRTRLAASALATFLTIPDFNNH